MSKETVEEEAQRGAPLEGLSTRVLVVDDEGAICRLMKKQLERDGHIVSTAGSVQAGVEALKKSFDVVVLDVDLPDGKGFELVDVLRSGRSSPTSVVMMTGNPNQAALDQSLNQGILEFLFKPFRYPEMRAAITRALEANRRWNERIAQLDGKVSVEPADDKPMDPSSEIPPSEITRLTALLVERHSLTEREHETLGLILRGFQNLEIAKHLNISANTVKYHVRNLLMKLGMESRTELFRSLLDSSE